MRWLTWQRNYTKTLNPKTLRQPNTIESRNFKDPICNLEPKCLQIKYLHHLMNFITTIGNTIFATIASTAAPFCCLGKGAAGVSCRILPYVSSNWSIYMQFSNIQKSLWWTSRDCLHSVSYFTLSIPVSIMQSHGVHCACNAESWAKSCSGI